LRKRVPCYPGLAGLLTGHSSLLGPAGRSLPIVTVRAARSALEQVDHVVAYVNIGASIESGSAFPVRALDAQGRGVAVLDIEPAEIAVEVDQEEPEEIGEE